MSLLDENGLTHVWNKMKAWVGNQLPEDMTGATTASAGIHGLVPAPTTADTEKFLRGDGSWADGNADENVTQTESTADADYRLLLSGSADDTTHTEGASKNSKFTANPSTGAVTFGTRRANSQIGVYSFTQGTNVTASGARSHAEGSYTIASNSCAHAEGYETTASGDMSHAEGANTIASGLQSHAEGLRTTASGEYGHAEGGYTMASGNSAHAEGNTTIASGNYSHTEGYHTTASGNYSHAEGNYTMASGSRTHTEGNNTTASGDYTHVEGHYTIANHKSQHVFGEYNLADTSTATASKRGDYVEIVGNGTSDARSNARTLDWSGNEVLSGKLTVGAAPTNDMDVATKKYVDDADNALNSSLPKYYLATAEVKCTSAASNSWGYWGYTTIDLSQVLAGKTLISIVPQLCILKGDPAVIGLMSFTYNASNYQLIPRVNFKNSGIFSVQFEIKYR